MNDEPTGYYTILIIYDYFVAGAAAAAGGGGGLRGKFQSPCSGGGV